MRIGIACASGSFKAAFVLGVLAKFEEETAFADMYAASSSAVIPASFAAFRGISRFDGVRYIQNIYDRYTETGFDISRAVLDGIQTHLRELKGGLFSSGAARFAVAVSGVITDEAAHITQGDGARRLGQKLVLSTRTGDRSWIDANLRPVLFDTRPDDGGSCLTPDNIHEVLYATTRMLHAWKTPAWIEGKPYVDASYTCMCPAVELARLGCGQVIAVSPEHGELYRDFMRTERMPDEVAGVRIRVIQPDVDLAGIGVDYLKVSDGGLQAAFDLGKTKGTEFLGKELVTW
jgi:hypothetical protein